MSKLRVSSNEIRVGHPLPWDVFDAGGTLLLRRGFVIDTQRALDRLVEDGLFLEDKDMREKPAPEPEPEKPSALQFIADARRLLGSPNQDIASIRDFSGRINRVAQLIGLACQTNANVAIASILLLQDHSYVVRHHINTAIIANMIARNLSLPAEQILSLTAAALTMNISMFEIQDKLNEVKGPLNDKVRALISSHPQQSEQRLRKLGVEDPCWLRCVEQHHEYENGAGYPKGLTGPDIDQGAKVIGLADRFCAQISKRDYRAMRPPGVVLKDIYIEKGPEIDPIVAAHLVRIVSIYPPGTIVRLRNSEIAIVTEPTDNPDTPIAYAVLGASGAAMAVPVIRKTTREDFKIMDVMTLDKVDFPIQMSRLWGAAARLH